MMPTRASRLKPGSPCGRWPISSAICRNGSRRSNRRSEPGTAAMKPAGVSPLSLGRQHYRLGHCRYGGQCDRVQIGAPFRCLSRSDTKAILDRRPTAPRPHLETRRCLHPPTFDSRRNLPGPLCARGRGIHLGQAAISPAPDTNCDRCTCQQGGPHHLGASHSRRSLSSAAAADRLIENSRQVLLRKAGRRR